MAAFVVVISYHWTLPSMLLGASFGASFIILTYLHLLFFLCLKQKMKTVILDLMDRMSALSRI